MSNLRHRWQREGETRVEKKVVFLGLKIEQTTRTKRGNDQYRQRKKYLWGHGKTKSKWHLSEALSPRIEFSCRCFSEEAPGKLSWNQKSKDFNALIGSLGLCNRQWSALDCLKYIFKVQFLLLAEQFQMWLRDGESSKVYLGQWLKSWTYLILWDL